MFRRGPENRGDVALRLHAANQFGALSRCTPPVLAQHDRLSIQDSGKTSPERPDEAPSVLFRHNSHGKLMLKIHTLTDN
jgi:hypothetical protein